MTATDTQLARDLTRSVQAFGRMIAQGKVVEAVLKRAKIDLTRADLQALRALQEAGAGVRPGDLAERLFVDAPTITRRVQLLEARHLVRRATDPCDRRAQLVQLTAPGARILDRAMAAYQMWLETVLSGWSGADRAQLAELLGRFTDGVYAIETHGR